MEEEAQGPQQELGLAQGPAEEHSQSRLQAEALERPQARWPAREQELELGLLPCPLELREQDPYCSHPQTRRPKAWS